MKLVTKLSVMAGTVLASAQTALAQAACDPSKDICPTDVPEISAMEGTAALVALAAIVLLTWERRRRAH